MESKVVCNIIHRPHHAPRASYMRHLRFTRASHRLMLIVAVLNLAGIVCLSSAASTAAARTPLTPRPVVISAASLLDSIGFTLMLPGVFFATIAFLCGRALTLNDQASRIIWYAYALVINLIIGWKIGTAIDNAPRP
jgi:hypothetical protein